MRPPGEIRAAICDYIAKQGPMPLVDLVHKTPIQSTPLAITNTIKNSVRAGVLVKVGHERRAHCTKWVALYDVAPDPTDNGVVIGHGFVVLGEALGHWRP